MKGASTAPGNPRHQTDGSYFHGTYDTILLGGSSAELSLCAIRFALGMCIFFPGVFFYCRVMGACLSCDHGLYFGDESMLEEQQQDVKQRYGASTSGR